MSEVKEIKKRIDFLDYLKAICVIMVIITHYACPRSLKEQFQ